MKVSVVISAYNEEEKIEECLLSVKEIAAEIVLVNSGSTDRTVEIASKYTKLIYNRENNPMLNVNKNYGFSKANGSWILSLDADERITDELKSEIESLTEGNIDGYYLPRKNIIFGKWIQHTGWYPDYQLRLFRRNKGKFAEKQVHEMLSLDGPVGYLKSPILHQNYESVSQFLNKMVRTYTVSEAENMIQNGYRYNPLDIIKMPLSEFIKRFFAESGYKDGMHGLVLSMLQAVYHFIVFLRLWEAQKYPDEKNTVEILSQGGRMVSHELKYWKSHTLIKEEKNPIKKSFFKIRRKVPL